MVQPQIEAWIIMRIQWDAILLKWGQYITWQPIWIITTVVASQIIQKSTEMQDSIR